MNLPGLEINLTLPDLWQQEAVRRLQAGEDVVVDAPTGAGKTYVFELLTQSVRIQGQAVFTVPTRALANDKLLEWRSKGWNVGIATGDIAENLNAPILVATLETQKVRLLRRDHPKMIVIDEYQMLADSARGVNYEMVIALAPLDTQLLLLSGSVRNPGSVVDWLRRIGRKSTLISHRERPVPQEQWFLDALPDRLPKSVFGYWPRYVGRALAANLDPILIFAPQRKDAERIARQVSASLPVDDPLELSAEQRLLAGDGLAKLLRSRVAFHHSGLSYRQRAGLIEPLAKAGQLRVVVATTGLGAGINFQVRSVIVSEREYRQNARMAQVRPDELLQMYGRAGRRGMDEVGYALVLPDKPRLDDASPMHLRRSQVLDWPAFIASMSQAVARGEDPIQAAHQLASHLFTETPPDLGTMATITPKSGSGTEHHSGNGPTLDRVLSTSREEVVEIMASNGNWERRKGPMLIPIGQTRVYHREKWRPALQVASSLQSIPWGNPCTFGHGRSRTYGKEWVVAHFPKSEDTHRVILSKGYRKAQRDFEKQNAGNPPRGIPKEVTLEWLDKHLRSSIPKVTGGGVLKDWVERQGSIVARIAVEGIAVTARKDACGQYLLAPPERRVRTEFQKFEPQAKRIAAAQTESLAPLKVWFSLGLIDANGHPTRRGIVFSYFNHGEGLAVAAALEDPDYPVPQLVWDLANLRAGHRFNHMGDQGSRLSYVCREAYGSVSYAGYLQQGVPEDYGEGASELVMNQTYDAQWKHRVVDEEVKTGDVERILLEWRSILRQVIQAPQYPWDRWLELQQHIQALPYLQQPATSLLDLPPLSSRQRSHKPMPFRWR